MVLHGEAREGGTLHGLTSLKLATLPVKPLENKKKVSAIFLEKPSPHRSSSGSCMYLDLLRDISSHSAWWVEAVALKTTRRNGGSADVVDGVDVEVEEGEDKDHQVPASSLHPLTVAQSCLVSKV